MTSETPKMTTVDAAELYVALAERELRSALSQIMQSNRVYTGMDYRDRVFAITKNRETFSTLSLTKGHYHPVGFTDDELTIVIFIQGEQTGFGLFKQHKVSCLPIDFDELIIEIMKEESPGRPLPFPIDRAPA